MSLEEAEERFGDFIALLSFGSNRPEVLDNVRYLMERHHLRAPEVPVCDCEIFNLEYAKKHADELYKAYSLLSDNQSKKVFEQAVLYKLDGDLNRLFSCETSENEAFDEILRLNKGDSFLDLGAYNGDTVLDFAKRVGVCGDITAVEPDPKSFAKLVNNTTGMKLCTINAAVSDKCGTIPFSFRGSRGSVAGGEKEIPCTTIDELCREKRFNYIKFDVEGKEADAILGGTKTLKQHKPKMLVSAYHRSDDFFRLPLLIHSINPEYKIYMRHYPYIPAWDTNFYFV
jgi:FkbM family methyltransferase